MPPRTTALAAWSQLTWAVAVAVLWTGVVLTLPVDPDYTAGEMLDHLLGWMETGLLYPALGEGPTLRIMNYPPLVLLLARGISEVGLPPLLAGRVANTLGLLALVGAVYGWARARGARGPALVGTVGLLGASFPVLYGAAQMHIELWAAALTVAGFALVDRGRGRLGPVLGGVALALACFSKQTQAVPALVALAWAWRFRRPAAPSAIAAFAGVGMVGSLAITAAWGAEPWRHMLTYTVGTYALSNLAFQALSHVVPWVALIALAGWTVGRARAEAARDALSWYWIGSAVWALSAARLGSGYPYFLDLHLGTLLLAGPRIFAGELGRPVAWLLAVQVVAADVGTGAALATNLVRGTRAAEQMPALCALMPRSDAVLAEEAGLARACGRVPVLHPFIVTSLAAQGLWDPAPFEAALRAGAYGTVVLPFDPRSPPGEGHRDRWTPGALAALRDAPSVSPAPAGRWVARW